MIKGLAPSVQAGKHMEIRTNKDWFEAVITSYNQGTMIEEAVRSVCRQTRLPKRIVIVDDGSADPESLAVLRGIQSDMSLPVPVTILFQENRGVSAARNAGIRQTDSPLVLVLDGDDRLEAGYAEAVSGLLCGDPAMVAASSWMRTFGVLDAVVCPQGGGIVPFLSRNCCPATHMLRKSAYEQCGGYEETMRSGFEDWDFFLSLLETAPDAHIGIVERPLLCYRTAPASANLKSMEQRLSLLRVLIERHPSSYRRHMLSVLLDLEAVSHTRLRCWEAEIRHTLQNGQALSEEAERFLHQPSYGDGGMAAAVRLATGAQAEDRV